MPLIVYVYTTAAGHHQWFPDWLFTARMYALAACSSSPPPPSPPLLLRRVYPIGPDLGVGVRPSAQDAAAEVATAEGEENAFLRVGRCRLTPVFASTE
jgi:hypothetical protein